MKNLNKEYDLFGKVIKEQHPQFKDKFVNPDKYYGSDLNKFVAERCKRDMVVNNIDLIINDYKTGTIRIIESKHSKERMGVGQKRTLLDLSRKGINTFCIYGNLPYNTAIIYSFQSDKTHRVSQQQLINFLNNNY